MPLDKDIGILFYKRTTLWDVTVHDANNDLELEEKEEEEEDRPANTPY